MARRSRFLRFVWAILESAGSGGMAMGSLVPGFAKQKFCKTILLASFLVSAIAIRAQACPGCWTHHDPCREPQPGYDCGTTSQGPAVSQNRAGGDNLLLTGQVKFSVVDEDSDGLAEALAADVEVSVLVEGQYILSGWLSKDGEPIAMTPRHFTNLYSMDEFRRSPGTYFAHLEFSGEWIYKSAENGPYQLHVGALSNARFEDSLSVQTPAYQYSDFGELKAKIVSATEETPDLDEDGLYDALRLNVEINVRSEGGFSLVGSLDSGDVFIASGTTSTHLVPGTHTVNLDFPGRDICRSRTSGPYEASIALEDSAGTHLSHLDYEPQATDYWDFEMPLMWFVSCCGSWRWDRDLDGLYEYLRVQFWVYCDSAGTYNVSGWLGEQEGRGTGFATAGARLHVPRGYSYVTLGFKGYAIRYHGVDGPYVLTYVSFCDTGWKVLGDVEPGCETSAFPFGEFE